MNDDTFVQLLETLDRIRAHYVDVLGAIDDAERAAESESAADTNAALRHLEDVVDSPPDVEIYFLSEGYVQ